MLSKAESTSPLSMIGSRMGRPTPSESVAIASSASSMAFTPMFSSGRHSLPMR